jgi:cobalamin biosynthesis protein CbiD
MITTLNTTTIHRGEMELFTLAEAINTEAKSYEVIAIYQHHQTKRSFLKLIEKGKGNRYVKLTAEIQERAKLHHQDKVWQVTPNQISLRELIEKATVERLPKGRKHKIYDESFLRK